MTTSLTIDNLDAEIIECLQAEADRRGVDVGAVAKQVLEEGLGPVTKGSAGPPYRDLKALAGTWSDEEAEAFLSIIADFDRIDEDMWK